MCATADRPANPLFRLAAAACLILMMIGLADRSFASVYDPGAHSGSASRASCDARHSDSGWPDPDDTDETDIPVMEAAGGLGQPRRLCPLFPEGGTSAPQRPPVRPPSF